MKKLLILVVGVVLLCSFTLNAQDEPKGKISGYMFGDYFYNVARDANNSSFSDAVLSGDKDFNGFAFRRIYFTYDYSISSTFATRFRVEADQSGNVSNGKFGLAVKDAYLKWKNIFSGSDLVIGLHPTPAFGLSEKVWGYRSLEKTILDLRGIVSSRDLGISLKGNLTENGSIKYTLMYGNNAGNKPEVDKYKRFYANLAFEPAKNFLISAYGDFKVKPDIDDPNSTTAPAAKLSNNVLTYALFTGYQEKGNFSVGVEGFYQSEQNGLLVNQSLENSNAIGISLFGSYDINEKFALIGRFDHFDPIANSNFEGDSRNFIIGGFSYKPDPKVAIMPNVMFESYEKLPNGQEFDSSVTARVTIYYEFL